MAVTNFKKISPERNPVDRVVTKGALYSGTGTPAVSDNLIKNAKDFPIGTMYINTTAPGSLHIRIATAGLVTDYSSITLTAGA